MAALKLFFLSSILLLSVILKQASCTDDYEYWRNLQQERQVRAQSPKPKNWDGLFSIQSASNNLYLSAKSGRGSVGAVILKQWSHTASQMWTATKYDTSRGYNLKPLTNDFNAVTSSVKNNAHTYNVWEFKNAVPVPPNKYLIFNTLQTRCLQTSDATKPVRFEKCQPGNPKQYWILHKID